MIETHANLNQRVKVKITKTGEIHLRKTHEELCQSCYKKGFEPSYLPPPKDAKGWSEFQLWEVMKLFGETMNYPNFNCHIQPEIILLDSFS